MAEYMRVAGSAEGWRLERLRKPSIGDVQPGTVLVVVVGREGHVDGHIEVGS
jgi:hypothetical protein